jgi:hypothetical protein
MLVGDQARAFASMLTLTADNLQRLSLRTEDSSPMDLQLQRNVIEDLQRNQLLTDINADAAPARQSIRLPEEDLPDPRSPDSMVITLHDTWRFFTSCALTSIRLRLFRIHATLSTIERRKQSVSAHIPADLPQLKRLARLFHRLRPLYPRDFLCLFDSIALLTFLAKYDYFPDLVFAVRLDPWFAHCWLQYGALALNQDIGEARDYLPIMII